MLRTSLRIWETDDEGDGGDGFLSSNAQDFIEDICRRRIGLGAGRFLSSNAQDFIEEHRHKGLRLPSLIPEQ